LWMFVAALRGEPGSTEEKAAPTPDMGKEKKKTKVQL